MKIDYILYYLIICLIILFFLSIIFYNYFNNKIKESFSYYIYPPFSDKPIFSTSEILGSILLDDIAEIIETSENNESGQPNDNIFGNNDLINNVIDVQQSLGNMKKDIPQSKIDKHKVKDIKIDKRVAKKHASSTSKKAKKNTARNNTGAKEYKKYSPN